MPIRRIMFLSLLVALAVGLLAPVAAFASGPSAGDQQYVDPLGGGSGGSGGGGGSNGSSGSGSSGSGSSGASSSGSGSSGAVTSSGSTGSVTSSAGTSLASSSTGAASSASTLPYTGFDATIAIVIGVGLIGSGFVVRRRILRS